MADIETLVADTRFYADLASAPATPAASTGVTFASNSKIYYKNDAGTESDLTQAGGGSVETGTPYEVDYAEITSDGTATATSTPGTTLITGSSVSFDGSTIAVVEFYCASVQYTATTGSLLNIELADGGTVIDRIGQFVVVPGDGNLHAIGPIMGAYRYTPSNASHTFSIRAWKNNAADTAVLKAGGNFLPAFLRVSKLTT